MQTSLVLFAIAANAFVFTGCVAVWFTVLRLRKRLDSYQGFLKPFWVAEPQTRPYWNVGAFFVMFGAQILLVGALAGIAISLGWLELPTPPNDAAVAPASSLPSLVTSLVINSISHVLAGLVAFGYLAITWLSQSWNRTPETRPKNVLAVATQTVRHLGLVPHGRDVQLGLAGAMMFLPIVMVIAAVASLLVPYEHPVLETLKQSPTWGLFGLMLISTVIVAPIAEEFMFRVLLQGSLQAVADRPVTNSAGPNAQPWRPQATWPIVVTSIVFALAHWGQGAAPIALFFLSLALGELYRQTGRITAPLVLHMTLNFITMCAQFSAL